MKGTKIIKVCPWPLTSTDSVKLPEQAKVAKLPFPTFFRCTREDNHVHSAYFFTNFAPFLVSPVVQLSSPFLWTDIAWHMRSQPHPISRKDILPHVYDTLITENTRSTCAQNTITPNWFPGMCACLVHVFGFFQFVVYASISVGWCAMLYILLPLKKTSAVWLKRLVKNKFLEMNNVYCT